MSQADAVVEPFGHTTLRRQRAGVLVVLVGAGFLALLVLAVGIPLTVIRFVNPAAVLGAAGLLVYAALSGAISTALRARSSRVGGS